MHAQVESSGRSPLHLGLLRRVLVRQSQGRDTNVSPCSSCTAASTPRQSQQDAYHVKGARLTVRQQCLAFNPHPLSLELLPYVGYVFVPRVAKPSG